MRRLDGRDPQVSVSTSSLTPCQHKAPRGLRVASDFRVVKMLKHGAPCEFHSLAEYNHAALLEGDPAVTRYVPQPFTLRIGQRRYVPDCYVVRDGQVEIVELRPQAAFDSSRRTALEVFFRLHQMRFVVMANDAILSRRIEAGNWRLIVQMLVCHRDLDTTDQEQELLETMLQRGPLRFGERVLRVDRAASRVQEIALLRLLHQGKVAADLTAHRFGYDTELRP